MIHPNLATLNSFLEKNFSQLRTQEFEENWSSELLVHYSSRERELQSGNFNGEFRVNCKVIMKLTSTQKILFYELLRILAIWTENPYFQIALDDLRHLYKQRTVNNSSEYSYLERLDDNQFAYEMDCYLWVAKKKRDFSRKINQKFLMNNKETTLRELISSPCLYFDFYLLPKRVPKEALRHKGYRDHGSLGSEFSKTLRDQANDWSLREEEEKREKEELNLHEYQLGLNGWI